QDRRRRGRRPARRRRLRRGGGGGRARGGRRGGGGGGGLSAPPRRRAKKKKPPPWGGGAVFFFSEKPPPARPGGAPPLGERKTPGPQAVGLAFLYHSPLTNLPLERVHQVTQLRRLVVAAGAAHELAGVELRPADEDVLVLGQVEITGQVNLVAHVGPGEP